MEFEQNMQAVGGGAFQLLPSSYRARLHGEAAVRYDMRRMQQQRDQMAIALHGNNQQHWSPSLLARSVTYFNLASEVIQKEEGRQRRLASRPTTFQFLRLMRDCRCAHCARAHTVLCVQTFPACTHMHIHTHLTTLRSCLHAWQARARLASGGARGLLRGQPDVRVGGHVGKLAFGGAARRA